MKKITKRIATGLMSLIMCVCLCACSFCESGTSASVQNTDPIVNGEFTVVDVREQLCEDDLDRAYYVTLVLKNSEGERYYYEYYSNSRKDAQYIALAKLAEGDTIIHRDGNFVLVE